MATKTNWAEAMKPLLKEYKNKKRPLDYKSLYQLFVMVVLSAQSTDNLINKIAPEFFNAFSDMESLSRATPDLLIQYISKVRNFRNKANWLIKAAQKIKTDKNIPATMKELTSLPGIGRKSANVIMREAGAKAEGIAVDLHVVRVAPRLGIVKASDPKKIEEELIERLPQKMWSEAGMAISFLGRETCRPKNPKHEECVMNTVCEYYRKEQAAKSKTRKAKV